MSALPPTATNGCVALSDASGMSEAHIPQLSIISGNRDLASVAPKTDIGCLFMSPRSGLMGALKCDDLRRSVRHLKVRFHHSHDANRECTANNKKRCIPNHRCCLP
jgi:hypothetical protein